MGTSELEALICGYMSRTCLIEFGDKVTVDTDLFDAGLIDSFGFINMVKFIEETFGVSLSDDDLASPELSTCSGIARLVASRRAAGACTENGRST